MIEDLQIGNWIQLQRMTPEQVSKGEYWTVAGLVLREDKILVNENWLSTEYVIPIPIKYGWLERFGFKKSKLKKSAFESHGFYKEFDKEVWVYSMSSVRHLLWGKNLTMVLGHSVEDFVLNPMPKIRYVHHVQNVLKLLADVTDNYQPDHATDKTALTEALYAGHNKKI